MASSKDHNCIDDEKLIKDIKEFGWAVIMIEATDYLPSFSYTIGLWKNYNHPELIAFGLTTKTLHSILNIGGALAKEGAILQTGREYEDFFDNGSTQFINVDKRNIKDYLGYAIWFNKTNEFPVLQLIWTDRKGKYPWDKSFEEEFVYRQPLLDRNADFKFREKKNGAVFTTRQWLEQHKPILRVVHDDDGEWQFLTGDQVIDDIRIVALEQMVIKDPTLNDIFNLDYNEEAERNFIGDEWVRNSSKDEE